MSRRSKALLSALVALPTLAALPARAAHCSITALPVALGVYRPFDYSPADSTGSVQVLCQGTVQGYSIALSTGGSGSYGPRQLSAAAGTLNYQLYLDAARSTVWGDGTGGTSEVAGAFLQTGVPATHTIYARIPALQRPSPGAYLDTIVVTLTW